MRGDRWVVVHCGIIIKERGMWGAVVVGEGHFVDDNK